MNISEKYVTFVFWVIYLPWLRLTKHFGSDIYLPKAFIRRQDALFIWSNNAQSILRSRVNVGIINHKLYLSTTSLLEYFIQPLLIDVEAITKIESDQEPALGKCYKFTIGEPSITKLLLEKEVIDQLEKDYGDLIFSSRTESNTD